VSGIKARQLIVAALYITAMLTRLKGVSVAEPRPEPAVA
jgi:hypothetical protein